MAHIESLLAARLFMVPQRVGDRLYFLSDLSGRISLYAMDLGGSVPEPLLPPNIALQTPHHMGGYSFVVFPDLDKILVMIDSHGDESYQPMVIPLDGGFPEPAFGSQFSGMQVSCDRYDRKRGLVYLHVDARTQPLNIGYQASLATGALVELGRGVHGPFFGAANADHTQVLSADAYGIGDVVFYLQEVGSTERRLMFGTPLEQRTPEMVMRPNGMGQSAFVDHDQCALCTTVLFD
ncbi:MAG: S9 family peptidase, partial [Herpetosiphonaceae bacterium]|nr:S9 family peptidase [Herpetosiphonaceae bacterium]